MKRYYLFSVAIISMVVSFAQPSMFFNYQAVVRDSLGSILPHQDVSFRISILSDTVSGIAEYVEVHDTTTNQFGLVVFDIGAGNSSSGALNNIAWGEKDFYLQIEVDINGGNNFEYMTKADLINTVPQARVSTKVILTDDNGKRYKLKVDTMGNIYTEELVDWLCGQSFTDVRDGQEYGTVLMGTQCWMTENLNIGIMLGTLTNQQDNGTIEKYCYNDSVYYCDMYGGLYQGDEMMDYTYNNINQGICPDGWHIPSNNEWCTLENYVDSFQISCFTSGWRGIDCGYKLKSTTGWYQSGNGIDAYGFKVLPSSYRYNYGLFTGLFQKTGFWTSSLYYSGQRWIRYFDYSHYNISRVTYSSAYGFSVRCIKD